MLAACPGPGNNPDVSLTAQDTEACSDLSCPVAVGSHNDLNLRTRPGTFDESKLVLTSSDESVVKVSVRGNTDGFRDWKMVAVAPGHADLVVTDVDGTELRRESLEVAPAVGFTLRFVFGFDAGASFEDSQVQGPLERAGYTEAWKIASDTQVTFGITPRSADRAPMMGKFDYTFSSGPGMTVSDSFGLPFVEPTAAVPGEYAVDILTNVAGLQAKILFIAE